VLVVVYAANGTTLLLERRQPPGYWQSVTGTLHAGETAPAAALREVTEETGIADVPIDDLRHSVHYPIAPAWRHRYAPAVTTNLEHHFALRLAAPVAVQLDSGEHVACAWLPFAQALERVDSASNRDALLRVAREA
jgi:dihydroneopterin triphosphate diphosphatase